MESYETRPANYTIHADSLKKLIMEHPDLPLVIFADDCANSGDYPFMTCSSITAEVGEVLDCLQEVDSERCYTDRSAFADDLEYNMEEERNRFDGSDAEWEARMERAISEYDPYWKPCIIVCVNN